MPTDPAATSRYRSSERGVVVAELVAVAVMVVAIGLIVWFATVRIQREGRAVDCRDELRDVKVAVMNYTMLTGKVPHGTEQLLTAKDAVRGGRVLDERPSWYEVGPDGEISRKSGAPSSCPAP